MLETKLIFDIDITGHHTEYISHLVDYLSEISTEKKHIFVLHYEFEERFPNIANKIKLKRNIQLIEITKEEYQRARKGNIIFQGYKHYSLMLRYARKYYSREVFLMHFNLFQLPLAFFRPSYKISGILFLQFYRMKKTTLNEKLKYYRKYIQTWLFVKNKQIGTIFILNDELTVRYLNKEFKTSIFKMLPDPVPNIKPLKDFSIRDEYQIKSGINIFLHIGNLDERKGTFEILDAILLLEEEELNQVAFLFIGKANKENDKIIQTKISLIKQKYPNANIIYKNEFISTSLMKSYFEQCDFVLIPYKNTEASSGILGHAIAAGKPVIGPNKGLLGELIVSNNLGILIEKTTPEVISKAIKTSSLFQYKADPSDYLEKHSISIFSSSILSE